MHVSFARWNSSLAAGDSKRMEIPDDTTARILASLAALPSAQRGDALLAAINRAIKPMSIYRLLEVRERVRAEFEVETEAVRATLELLNGQLALREIAGSDGWR